MKKRILAITVTLFLCIGLALPTFAQETAPFDTVTVKTVETVETVEPVETTVIETLETPETLVDELPEGIENVEKEQLLEIINGLSGEGIDKIQELLLAGINSIERGQSTTWDKIADFCERHIEAISLISFAIAAIVYTFTRLRSNKKLRDNIGTATNNAVETVEIAKQMNADSIVALENTARSVDSFKETLGNATDRIEALMEENRQMSEENESLRSALRHNSSADMLVADTVNELLQLANIPQNKKDAIYSKITAAKALIESEGKTDEGKDEKTDKAPVV